MLGSDPSSGQLLLTDLSGSSHSDIDIGELVYCSDRNLSDSESSLNSACYAGTASQGLGPVRSSSHKRISTDQNQINQHILTQLNTISDKLIRLRILPPRVKNGLGLSKVYIYIYILFL